MIEVRVPISPTPSFLNRTRLLAASIRRFYPDTIVRAYVGQEIVTDADAARVREAFTGHDIGWEWVKGREFAAWEGTRSPYLATMNARWRTPADGTHVLIADCDILMADRIDELLTTDAVQGVQAHIAALTNEQWRYLFAINSCKSPSVYDHLYSGAGIMGPAGERGPWYVNSGVCLIPREYFELMCPHYHSAVNVARSALRDSYWVDQLALAVAAAKAKVPVRTLPTRYNHPNQRAFDEAYPEELRDIRIVHYLRTDTIDRDRDFADLMAMRKLAQRTDLTGSNEVVRRTVAETMGCLEPPRLTDAKDAPYA